MVPMVDCVMVLLIFLMISTAFVNDPGIEVQKPMSAARRWGSECPVDCDLSGQPHLLRWTGNSGLTRSRDDQAAAIGRSPP